MTQPASLIPGVTVGDIIGRGGFSVVYRGHQQSVDREVAIKVDTRTVETERDQRRFLREATAAGRIGDHPHVVSLYDVGVTSHHHPYLVMELCPGGTVRDLMRAQGPFSAADTHQLGLALASALAAAHTAQVLHRDIKPANILIDRYGTPRLSDFGLAALVRTDEELSVTLEALTPAFAAPEALRFQPPTPASDVWSLGATLHATLMGRSARTRDDGSPAPVEQIMEQLDQPLPLPHQAGVGPLIQVLAIATDPDPARRYPDGQAFLEAWAAVDVPGTSSLFTGGPVASTPARPPAPVPPPRRPWRSALVGGVAGLLVGAGSTWALTRGLPEPEAAPGRATTPPSSAPTESTPAGTAPDPEAAPEAGQCWDGIVSIAGHVSAQQTDCAEPHLWETFASGLLDPLTPSATLDDVFEDPNVQLSCTADALADYTNTRTDDLEVAVIPPSEVAFAGGSRGFACVATVTGSGPTTGSLKDR
ncbi:MAG: protein kinase domain-containing protein [Propioniciclava sp.]